MAIIIGPDNPDVTNNADHNGQSRDLVGDLGAGNSTSSSNQSTSLVVEGSAETFAEEVIQRSMETPVIVDFWAPWCGPCKQLGPSLEKLVKQAGGSIRLVKINIDEQQELAAQMRVQSIPMVYAFSKGQPIDGFQGAIPESQLKEFIKRISGGELSPVDTAIEHASRALESNDPESALRIFEEVLKEDENNNQALAGVIRCLTMQENYDGARQTFDALSLPQKNDPAIKSAIAALDLAETAEPQDTSDVKGLKAQLEKDPSDHQLRFDYAMTLYNSNKFDGAIDELIELVKRDRTWNNGAAREQLLKIFEALGHDSPYTIEGRKKLSSVLFA